MSYFSSLKIKLLLTYKQAIPGNTTATKRRARRKQFNVFKDRPAKRWGIGTGPETGYRFLFAFVKKFWRALVPRED
jgi:hypothetical protein